MLVVHPIDATTDMLCLLYEGVQAGRLTQHHSKAEIKHALNHALPAERILLLGHGNDKGLLSRTDANGGADYDRLIISHSHSYYLRRHGHNVVGIWCHADSFAKAEGLHGLFSGMIITEMSEAEEYGIPTTPEELARENLKLAQRLRALLDEGLPLAMIPQRMASADDAHTPLTTFNYARFYYL